MSLRKSPELTPALLAAARRNAQHSTGPRSPAAKQNVKLNALKHGAYARDETAAKPCSRWAKTRKNCKLSPRNS